jgi:hypothetical protein
LNLSADAVLTVWVATFPRARSVVAKTKIWGRGDDAVDRFVGKLSEHFPYVADVEREVGVGDVRRSGH